MGSGADTVVPKDGVATQIATCSMPLAPDAGIGGQVAYAMSLTAYGVVKTSAMGADDIPQRVTFTLAYQLVSRGGVFAPAVQYTNAPLASGSFGTGTGTASPFAVNALYYLTSFDAQLGPMGVAKIPFSGPMQYTVFPQTGAAAAEVFDLKLFAIQTSSADLRVNADIHIQGTTIDGLVVLPAV